MKNIKENKRVIGEKVRWLTDDPDILIETITTSKTINLKELRERKERLEQLISGQPSAEDLVAMETARLADQIAQFQAELNETNTQLNG